MLEKCSKELGYTEKENSYYSKGIPIWKSDSICIDDKTDGEKNIPWTLMNYIEYSNVHYASKAKFYCVAKSK